MFWTEATVYTTTEGIEPVSGILLMNDITGYSVVDAKDFNEFLERREIYWDYIEDELFALKECETQVTFYLPDNAQGRERLAAIRKDLERLKSEDSENLFGRLTVEIGSIADEDWENNWKQYFKPFSIGKNIVIKPTWENYDKKDGQTIIEIDPASSFGSGSHMTTRLCLESIEKLILDGKKADKLLDMGCGSGILGIGAYLLAGSEVVAVDIEENSIRIAKENAEINRLPDEKFHPYVGNVITDKELYDTVCSESYDIIAANIVSDIIIMMAPMFKKVLAKDGRLIVSGIISERADEVEGVLKKYNFVREDFFDKEGWAAIVLRHGE
ncbi:MAG: 50S ribosomal protein L11 methyltransferase [Clostridia bacterium]|nr:50S ribosomal protein L11 methyltransferase [Clostridia bacterium]